MLTVKGQADELERRVAQPDIEARRRTTGANPRDVEHFRHDGGLGTIATQIRRWWSLRSQRGYKVKHYA